MAQGIELTKFVYGWPDELRAIKGVSPIAGKITLRFSNCDAATLQVNDGPELYLEDKGDYWQPIGERAKPNNKPPRIWGRI